jgi:hypothetical protein
VTGLHPTSELVAAAWISQMTGIPPDAIATQAPQDTKNWANFGDLIGGPTDIVQFITVRTMGGSPHRNTPLARPIVEVTCFATKPNSNKPPWFAANQTLELIRLATYERRLYHFGQALVVTTGGVEYNTANVLDAVCHTEPRRLYSDVRNYAIYQVDIGFTWREVGLLIP